MELFLDVSFAVYEESSSFLLVAASWYDHCVHRTNWVGDHLLTLEMYSASWLESNYHFTERSWPQSHKPDPNMDHFRYHIKHSPHTLGMDTEKWSMLRVIRRQLTMQTKSYQLWLQSLSSLPVASLFVVILAFARSKLPHTLSIGSCASATGSDRYSRVYHFAMQQSVSFYSHSHARRQLHCYTSALLLTLASCSAHIHQA